MGRVAWATIVVIVVVISASSQRFWKDIRNGRESVVGLVRMHMMNMRGLPKIGWRVGDLP